MDNFERLNIVFDEIGKQFGYMTVRADFEDFREFKVKWERGHNWIEFKISDYLRDAPIEVLEDLAQSIYEKIAGDKGAYKEHMIEYAKSDEFVEKNRPIYLKRSRFLMGDPDGEVYDLQEIYRSLVRQGLLEDLYDNIHFTWAADDYKLAHVSVLMKVAGISYILDQKSTPREAAEAAVYEAVQMIRDGQRYFGMENDGDGWKSHPEKKTLDQWLKMNKMTF